MKSINRNDFVEIGSVVKVHGTQGWLKVILTGNSKFKEWAFLAIRGKPVPFYIEQSKHNYQEEAFLKFQDVNDMETASKLVGYLLLAPIKESGKKNKVVSNNAIIQYKIIDSKHGELGIVEELLELPMQILIKTNYNNQELLIPAIEPILVKIDDDQRIVYVNLPDGLLDI